MVDTSYLDALKKHNEDTTNSVNRIEEHCRSIISILSVTPKEKSMVERCDEIDAIISNDVQPQHDEISNSGVKHDDKETMDNLLVDSQEENRNSDLTDSERLNRFRAN